jgi:adenosine deaminase
MAADLPFSLPPPAPAMYTSWTVPAASFRHRGDPMLISQDLIRLLPKTDLHLHLDGSLRVGTLIELARQQQVELPSYTEDGLLEQVFKENYASLTEYLEGFRYTVAVLQTPEALEQVSYELMEDNILEGVRYIEVRFAPQLHVQPNLSWKEVLEAVDRGLRRATRRYNEASVAIRRGEEPPYAYGIIACSLRKFEPVYSDYYRRLFEIHRYSPPKEIYRLASLELARAMVDLRDRYSVPVVGFDLAGDEKGYPAIDHRDAFDFAHKNFLKKTVHAGESYGPESIFQAITDLHADRIGHGYSLFHPEMIRSDHRHKKDRYSEDLSQFIADRRITIEVCLSSNIQTNPNLKDLDSHSFKQMKEHRLSTTICTDNRLVSRTTVCRELGLTLRHFPHTVDELKDLLIYGFKRSFYPGDYPEKRAYVRQAFNLFEKLQREHLPGADATTMLEPED